MENLANPQDIQFLVSFHPPRVPIPVSNIRGLLNTSNGPPSTNEHLRKYAVILQGPSPAHPLAPPQTIAYCLIVCLLDISMAQRCVRWSQLLLYGPCCVRPTLPVSCTIVSLRFTSFWRSARCSAGCSLPLCALAVVDGRSASVTNTHIIPSYEYRSLRRISKQHNHQSFHRN